MTFYFIYSILNVYLEQFKVVCETSLRDKIDRIILFINYKKLEGHLLKKENRCLKNHMQVIQKLKGGFYNCPLSLLENYLACINKHVL